MKQKPGVMVYFDIIPVLAYLSNEDKGILFQAMLEYAEGGIYPPLNERLALIWPLIQQKMDRDWDRYQLTVIKRKYAAYARWEKQHDRTPLPYNQWVDQKGFETEPEDYDDALVSF